MRKTHMRNIMIAFILVFVLLIPTSITASSTTVKLWIGSTNMTVNGVQQPIDSQGTKPVAVEGRTLVPIRAIVEAFGGSVSWAASLQQVTVTLGSDSLVLWIGSKEASLNGVSIPIDDANPAVVPVVMNGRMLLPLRFVAESLGIAVQYDPAAKMITLVMTPKEASWTLYTVDSIGDVGGHTAIAVDSNDKVHISYIDSTNGKLKYMTIYDKIYNIWIVDSARNYSTDIAADANGYCHIVYDGMDGDLRYATNAVEGGSSSAIESDVWSGVAGDNSIALDSNGNVHISYFKASDLELKYATNASGAWYSSVPVSVGLQSFSASIGVDSNNRIHISYYDDSSPDSIKYVTNASGAWVVTTIDAIGFAAGWKTSLVVDSNNRIHITYYNWTYDALMYATNASGSWKTETVDDSSGGVWNASIAIDKANGNRVHVVYGSNSGFMYAVKTGGSWQISKIDESWTGSYNSIAIGKDAIHVSYYDGYNTDLKYAVKPLS